jgi:GH35 family endo-1,4-beta-xylanase
MGKITFQLPADLPADAARELERACLAGGPDNMPQATVLHLNGDTLTLSREEDESGFLIAPWSLDDLGQLMGTSATLMSRAAPYRLLVELARGKINQVRCQAADWRLAGLHIGPLLQNQMREATMAFGGAVCATSDAETAERTREALSLGYQAAEQLAHAYVEQVFAIRHQRQPRLESTLACRFGPTIPTGATAEMVLGAFNSLNVPLSWHTVEQREGEHQWQGWDAAITWAEKQGVELTAGPLVDFSPALLPEWLWEWEGDVAGIAAFVCKFVEQAVRRYHHRIRRWQIAAGGNCARLLSLTEEELLGLTYRSFETARQIDSGLELVLGVAQPWGDYMGGQEFRRHSPFLFADTLIRSNLNLWALDVELVMGVTPRGSYCRDVLEASRVLDLYALLGLPVRVTMAYPSSARPDPLADPEMRIDAGRWRQGFTPQIQAEWAAQFSAVALCKPFVQSVLWPQLSDAEPHQFPNAGLFDEAGQVKPALSSLRHLRETHLR